MENEIIVSDENISKKIYLLRDQKVMLDSDLAELYQVETKALNQAVKRNLSRFPEDFMFQLTKEEYLNLKSQSVTTSWGEISIHIMRIYIKMREMLQTHKDLIIKMEELEKCVSHQDGKILSVLKYLKQFAKEQQSPREKIGFKQKAEEPQINYKKKIA